MEDDFSLSGPKGSQLYSSSAEETTFGSEAEALGKVASL